MNPLQLAATLRDAIRLANMDVPVFRIEPGEKDHYVDADWNRGGSSFDPVVLLRKFSGGQTYNLGCWGGGRFLFIDVDCLEAWAEVLKEIGPLPPTFTVRTPSGGLHLYFDNGGKDYGQTDLVPGKINVRARGGYVVGPGSTGVSKHTGEPGVYTIVDATPPAPLPAKLDARLSKASPKPKDRTPVVDADKPDALARAWAIVARTKAVAEGARDNTAHKLAGLVKAQGVSELQALEMVRAWNETNPDPLPDDEIMRGVGSTYSTGSWRIGEHDPARDYERIEGAPEPTAPAAAESPKLPFKTVSTFAGKPVPPREMHVDPWIPARDITMLGGDGGVGKSLLGKQLAVATAAGKPWLGYPVKPGPVVFLGAEDDEDELHRRFAAIAAHEGIDLAALANLHYLCLAGDDAVLAAANRGDVLQPTKLWLQFHEQVMDVRPALVIFDTQADLFAGNENSRPQAQQFVKMLRGLALKSRSTGVLLSHPSLAGMASGSGTSGSTAWSNSVRNRLYLSRVLDNEARELDPDARTLTNKKANYGRRGLEMKARWFNGVFVPDTGDVAAENLRATDARAKAVFMELLVAHEKQGRNVSPSLARNYAPARFAEHPKAKGLDSKALERAMEALIEAGRVKVVTEGPPSKRRIYLRATGVNAPEDV